MSRPEVVTIYIIYPGINHKQSISPNHVSISHYISVISLWSMGDLTSIHPYDIPWSHHIPSYSHYSILPLLVKSLRLWSKTHKMRDLSCHALALLKWIETLWWPSCIWTTPSYRYLSFMHLYMAYRWVITYDAQDAPSNSPVLAISAPALGRRTTLQLRRQAGLHSTRGSWPARWTRGHVWKLPMVGFITLKIIHNYIIIIHN